MLEVRVNTVIEIPGPPVIRDILVRIHVPSVTPTRRVPPFTLSFTNQTLAVKLPG